MAVVSRVSTLTFENGLGGSRSFVATAAVQDTAAGGDVTITLVHSQGATSPGLPNTVTLSVKNCSGTVIRSYSMPTGVGTNPVTFSLTSDGVSGSAARADTMIIDIRATRTDIGTYDYETDGSPNTPPTGYSASTVDRGWIRAITTYTIAVSNVALGGAKTEPAQYDESLYARSVLGADSYIARALTVSADAGSLSSATNSTTSATKDVTFASVVDDRFSAASASVTFSATAPNETLTSQPFVSLSGTTDSITVDPRLTVKAANGANGFHFQKNDTTFDATLHDSTYQMLNSDLGYCAARLVAARGTGINGLTYSLTSTSAINGQVTTTNGSTATVDGELGWTAMVEVCPNGKPGGAYDIAVDVTAPADIDPASYVSNPTGSVTVLAKNPNIEVLSGMGAALAAQAGHHFVPGEILICAASLVNSATGEYVAIDASPAPSLRMFRLNPDLGRGEYLIASPTGVDVTDWLPLNGDAAPTHAMSALAGDAAVKAVTFSAAVTAGWAAYDIVAIPVLYSGATPYSGRPTRELVSALNRHDRNDFDPTGLYK